MASDTTPINVTVTASAEQFYKELGSVQQSLNKLKSFMTETDKSNASFFGTASGLLKGNLQVLERLLLVLQVLKRFQQLLTKLKVRFLIQLDKRIS